ncbi:MAG TPA: CehA/McbA family metallohydrolase [Pirellulaceae bacterium]|nr:CehA/McbA family metallohydrolase [Pirellulaceae bacterium]
MQCRKCWLKLGLFILMFSISHQVSAHDQSRLAFVRALVLAQTKADAQAEDPEKAGQTTGMCDLTLEIADSFAKPTPGLIRLTNLASGKALKLTGEIHRALNWYAVEQTITLKVPRTELKIEAIRGLQSELTTREIDLTDQEIATVKVTLRQFYDAATRGLMAGNTHLHLNKMTLEEADRYLRVVPPADGLELVFLSLLRRIPDERDYISNLFVRNSFGGGDLQRLSQSGVLFANGEEHRHNFGRGGEGYGHVMLLDLQELIRPVSIGPGIMRAGTDGMTLRRGIQRARDDDATVIWCHNNFGLEDIPNWLAGLVDAQNIFDGGNRGGYDASYYRYLNIGLKVPFSSGTDWMVFDFSRVYVPVDGELSTKKWLKELRAGRSYITNGPFLELETERGGLGDTLRLPAPNRVTVVGRGIGRQNFGALELVYNGKVVHRVPATQEGGYYFADMRHGLEVGEPGWFALRIPSGVGKTELDGDLFAHTSPIYVNVGGKSIFRKDVAQELIGEIEQGITTIKEKGLFGTDAARNEVLRVHQDAVMDLKQRIKQAK